MTISKQLNIVDCYKILGVLENSSIEEVKKAYHEKAKKTHPDKGGNDSAFASIHNAYQEIIKADKYNFKSKIFTQENDNRKINKCEKCGNDTYYTLCLDCWIKVKKEEKRQRIHNIRSFMLCLNCDKSLYNKNPRTLFCDIKCSKEYHKKRGKPEPKKPCSHKFCLSKEEAFRLKKIDMEKILILKYKERIAIFTRLIGKDKAGWFDTMINKEYRKD